MSKSLGNTVDPIDIMNTYGADAARFFILFGASPKSGLDWSDEGVDFAFKFITNFFTLMCDNNEKIRKETTLRDNLIEFYLNKTIKNVTESFEKIALRKVLNEIIQFTSEFTKYKNEGINEKIFYNCKKNVIKLLHPIIPHVTEEIWEFLGNNEFLSLSTWPLYDEKILSIENEYKWKLLDNTINSINHILHIIKEKDFKYLSIIIAADWKYNFMSKLFELIENIDDSKIIIKELMKEEKYRQHGKFISQIVGNILKNRGKYVKSPLSAEEEYEFFTDLKQTLEKKFSCNIMVLFELDSTEKKAIQALPSRPAIIFK